MHFACANVLNEYKYELPLSIKRIHQLELVFLFFIRVFWVSHKIIRIHLYFGVGNIAVIFSVAPAAVCLDVNVAKTENIYSMLIFLFRLM